MQKSEPLRSRAVAVVAALLVALAAAACDTASRGDLQRPSPMPCPSPLPDRLQGIYDQGCIEDLFGGTIAFPDLSTAYEPPVFDIGTTSNPGSVWVIYESKTGDRSLRIDLHVDVYPAVEDFNVDPTTRIGKVKIRQPKPPVDDQRQIYTWPSNGWFYRLQTPTELQTGLGQPLDVVKAMIEAPLNPQPYAPSVPLELLQIETEVDVPTPAQSVTP